MELGWPAFVLIIAIPAASVLWTIHVWRRGAPSWWTLWALAGLSLALGIGAAIVLDGMSPLVRVHADMSITESRLIGPRTETIRGHEVELYGWGSRTVIVNESDRTLQIRRYVFGQSPPDRTAPPQAAILPGSAYTLDAPLDLIGPLDRPSSTRTKTRSNVKYWLTW